MLDREVCDASVLILPEIGFIAAESPEFLATLDMVEARLMRGGFVLRYELADDFGPPEAAFLLCSFWYAGALALAGRREQARVLFERILAARNHVGLLSEDLHPGGRWPTCPAMGQFSANLFTGRADFMCHAPVAKLGGWVMARLVIVSNRVPDPAERGPRAGGLVVSLAEALAPGSLWFGWSGKTAAHTSRAAKQVEAGGLSYATIDLGEADYRAFYLGFSNGSLWPLFHMMPGNAVFDRGDYAIYREVNQAFAAALLPLLQPG